MLTLLQDLKSHYYLLAAFNAISWSSILIFYRYVMSKGADAKALMIFGQLGASLFLVAALGMPNYLSLDRYVVAMLVLSGMLWAIGVFLEIIALEHIEASVSGIIAAARYIVGFLTGVLILHEKFTLIRAAGVLLIVGSILGISEFKKLSFKKGFWLTMLSVFFQVAAFAVDKVLAEIIPAGTIVISSFFFPGITFLILYPMKLLAFKAEFTRSHGIVALLPIALALCYLALVEAFANAEFVSTMAISESSLIFTCLLAYLLLGEKRAVIRKLICSMTCAAGVVLVCLK